MTRYRNSATGAVRESSSRLGYPWIEQSDEAPAPASPLTKDELRDQLDELGVQYGSRATRDELEHLLEVARQGGSEA